MHMKQYSYMFAMIVFLVMMLIFPTETFAGANSGLLLWFQVILPTLLPFLILSNLLIHTNSVSFISRILKPFFQKLFRVSDQASYAVLIGFLCGYPMGAKVVADLIKTKRISTEEGQYLISFCNNASPMFIISFIVTQNLKDQSLLLGTILILFLSPLLCSYIFRRFYHYERSGNHFEGKKQNMFQFSFQIFDTSIMNGFETITKIGGYIILFSIILTFGSKLPVAWFVPTLEISNGILYIMELNLSFTSSYVLVLTLTSFGGFCAAAQTYSMIQGTKLRMFPYIIQKLITALVTSLLAYCYIVFIHQ